MEYGCVYSFVGRRRTTTETTAAAAAHLGVTTYIFFFSYSYVTFLMVLYNNIHHHVAFAKEFSYDPLWRGFFFLGKLREKKARFSRAPHDNIVFTGPTIYQYISSCVFTGPTIRTSYSFLFFFEKSGVYPCVSAVFWYHKYLPQPPIVFASSSIDKHGSQLSTAGIRQQTAAVPTSQQQHSKSSRVYITPGNCVANPASPRAPLASPRLRK